ncbi:MAG: hypothetical protein ABWY54_00755 [Glaciihabitans sp.]
MARVDLHENLRNGEQPGSGAPSAYPGRSRFGAAMARYGSATVAHYVTLLLGAALLAYMGRAQGFFYDDWALLVGDADNLVNAPHVGHWSATPALVFLFLRNTFGLDSYVPYLALVLVVHLATVHLLWRIMVRIGVQRWIAVALAVLMMFLGAGGENIFWAFQFGFVGALAVGLWAIVLIDRAPLTPWAGIAVAVLALWALTFSGTAIPLVGAAMLVSWARHGILKTIYVFAAPLLSYAAWYFGPGASYDGSASQVDGTATEVLLSTLEYAGHMLVDGLQKLSPIPSLGIILVIALLAWCARGRPAFTSRATPGYALVAAAIVFALLTGFSRAGLGTDNASSSRYVYLVVALVIPAFGMLATQLAQRGWLRVGGAVAIIGLGIVYNAGILYSEADRQAIQEEQSRGRLAAALSLAEDSDGRISLNEHPVARWAPDVSVSDLFLFEEEGWITDHSFDDQDLLDVGSSMLMEFEPAVQAELSCAVDNDGAIASLPESDDASFYLPSGGTVSVFLHAPGMVGLAQDFTLDPGWWTLDNGSTFQAQLSGPAGSLETCAPVAATAP